MFSSSLSVEERVPTSVPTSEISSIVELEIDISVGDTFILFTVIVF